MIRKYLNERKRWIGLFTLLQLLLVFVAWIDNAIPLKPILYIVFLSTLVLLFFLLLTYPKETKFYEYIESVKNPLDITEIPKGDSPFEKIIHERLTDQAKKFTTESSQSKYLLQQEKDELLSWVHEVKTPLTAMRLIIDRLHDSTAKADLTYEWLRIHLSIDQQLHQKRIPFMENDLYIENTTLQPLLSDEIRTLRSWCKQKNIGFEIDLQIGIVVTDAKWLAFIIRQLLTNAVKYSDNADIYIKSYQKEGQTFLEIQDFGRGIHSKDLPRIFEKGYTSTTNHQDSTATGLGLYLAKKVAQHLLIAIEAQSIFGVSTTFTLHFPRKNDFLHKTGM